MTDYKLMPEEATPEMEQAAEKYWNDRKFKAFSGDPRTWKGLYAAMRAAAPAVQGEPVGWYTEDHLDDKSATTYKAEVAQRWRDKGWPIWPLYATPQPVEQSTFTVGTDLSDGKLTVVVMKHESGVTRLIHTEVIQLAKQQPSPDVSALVEALKWLRGAINCTPENDKYQRGTWISTSHPRIKRIDALIAAYRKGEES